MPYVCHTVAGGGGAVEALARKPSRAGSAEQRSAGKHPARLLNLGEDCRLNILSSGKQDQVGCSWLQQPDFIPDDKTSFDLVSKLVFIPDKTGVLSLDPVQEALRF